MSQPLARGTVIGGHVIDRVIGQGGFGITYRAHEATTGEEVAIKEYLPTDHAIRLADGRVSPRPGQDDLFRLGLRAFYEEAQLLRQLPRLDTLVRVRSAFEKFSTAYCVMDFIRGESLDGILSRMHRHQGAIPEALVRDLLLQILAALNAIHGARLVHRDIKPSNVMLKRDGKAVLIDFGAAAVLNRKGTAASMYTRRYAALEQVPPERTGFRPKQGEGPWSDLFALSVMTYDMVSQSLPPAAEDRWKAVRGGDADPYLPVRDNLKRNRVEAVYSDRLLDAIDGGCRLFPEDRPQGAPAFARALTGSAGTIATPPAGPGPASAPRARPAARSSGSARRDRGPRALAILAILILILALLSVFMARRGNPVVLEWLFS